MKKNKRYKVIIVILVIYFLFLFIFLGINNIKKNNHEATLLIGNDTIWNYSDRDWLNITSSSAIEELGWKEYKVYLDNKYFGDYLLWYDDSRWYAFNEDKSAVKTEGTLIAYQSNYDLKISPFQTKEITNNTYVHQVLRENKLSTASNLTVNDVVNFDIDNDGLNEDFYIISNAFPIDNYPKTYFSIVFMVKDNIINPIYTNIEDAKHANSCKPFIRSFLDIDEDDKYEVIVSCAKYSIQKPEDMLYQLTDEGMKLLISNQ